MNLWAHTDWLQGLTVQAFCVLEVASSWCMLRSHDWLLMIKRKVSKHGCQGLGSWTAVSCNRMSCWRSGDWNLREVRPVWGPFLWDMRAGKENGALGSGQSDQCKPKRLLLRPVFRRQCRRTQPRSASVLLSGPSKYTLLPSFLIISAVWIFSCALHLAGSALQGPQREPHTVSLNTVDMTICQALRVSERERLPHSSGQLALCWTLIITLSERGIIQSWNSRHYLWMKWGQKRSGKTRDELAMTAVWAALERWPYSFEGSFWNPTSQGFWPLDSLLLYSVALQLLNRTFQQKLLHFSTPEQVPRAKEEIHTNVLLRSQGREPQVCTLLMSFNAWLGIHRHCYEHCGLAISTHLSDSVPARMDPGRAQSVHRQVEHIKDWASENSAHTRKGTGRVFCIIFLEKKVSRQFTIICLISREEIQKTRRSHRIYQDLNANKQEITMKPSSKNHPRLS